MAKAKQKSQGGGFGLLLWMCVVAGIVIGVTHEAPAAVEPSAPRTHYVWREHTVDDTAQVDGILISKKPKTEWYVAGAQ